jgi:hypothetical protein
MNYFEGGSGSRVLNFPYGLNRFYCTRGRFILTLIERESGEGSKPLDIFTNLATGPTQHDEVFCG